MKIKKFNQIVKYVSAAVGGVIGIAVVSGNIIAAVITMFVSQLAMYWLKSRVTEVTTDEMTMLYEGKIARKVYDIFSLTITFVAVVLMCLRAYGETLYIIGITLTATAIFAILLQGIVRSLYTRGFREDGDHDNE